MKGVADAMFVGHIIVYVDVCSDGVPHHKVFLTMPLYIYYASLSWLYMYDAHSDEQHQGYSQSIG